MSNSPCYLSNTPLVRLRGATRRLAAGISLPVQRQGGTVIVIVLMTLIVLLAVCGFALNLAFVYNRKVELQNLADATALAAARELDGTTAGIDRALASAAAIARTASYAYGRPIEWSDAAVSFSYNPRWAPSWGDAAYARYSPATRLFVKVDTAALAPVHAIAPYVFMHLADPPRITSQAIAGRTGIEVTPLAVCALSPQRATARPAGAGAELVEYGFRRGVSYDLMHLNPGGTSPENFIVNPFAPAGTLGSAVPTSTDIAGAYVCAGRMSIITTNGGNGKLTVVRPFPMASFYNYFNSRFDQFGSGACVPAAAPPDTNVRAYTFDGAVPWMAQPPAGQGAAAATTASSLVTVADPVPAPATTTGPMYGPLWSYAKAVPYSAYVQGALEPAGGYGTFETSQWDQLYNPGQPGASAAYPAGGTPYQASGGSYFQAPSGGRRGQRGRRVLNIPLLSCPVAAGSTTYATVLGVGKFFMTVPATPTSLVAEFSGLVTDQQLGASTVLYP